MDALLHETNRFLRGGGFGYAICGGHAIDLFLGKTTRPHSDIDISARKSDKRAIIEFMRKSGWEIYEFRGQGIVRRIVSASDFLPVRNLMCVKNPCEIVKFHPCEKGGDYLRHEFFHIGMTAFNYLEFLFNDLDDNDFIFSDDIRRPLCKAILHKGSIPFLAPEIVLLYKSADAGRCENALDFENATAHMDAEQLHWLNLSLAALYPHGHIWQK